MILSQLSEAHLAWCCRSNSGDYIIGIEIPLHHMGFSLDSRHLSGMRETARALSLEFWIPSAPSECFQRVLALVQGSWYAWEAAFELSLCRGVKAVVLACASAERAKCWSCRIAHIAWHLRLSRFS
jgi:hypothetical protein